MTNILIIENNYEILKILINFVTSQSKDFRLVGVTYNVDEGLKLIMERKPKVIIINLQTPNNTGIQSISELESIINYRPYIIITSNQMMLLYGSVEQYLNSRIGYSILLKTLKDISTKIEDEKVKEKIVQQLYILNYNFKYKGTQYLQEVIYEIYIRNDIDSCNLNKNIYPIIAKKYNKDVNNIKCNITQATKYMYCDCKDEIILNYFKYSYFKKPTVKEVVYTTLNKL